MTKEQIEAARERIAWAIQFHERDKVAEECLDRLNALCEAARHPESLVGKRVRLTNPGKIWADRVFVVAADPKEYSLRPEGSSDNDGNFRCLRDGFELLEDTNE